MAKAAPIALDLTTVFIENYTSLVEAHRSLQENYDRRAPESPADSSANDLRQRLKDAESQISELQARHAEEVQRLQRELQQRLKDAEAQTSDLRTLREEKVRLQRELKRLKDAEAQIPVLQARHAEEVQRLQQDLQQQKKVAGDAPPPPVNVAETNTPTPEDVAAEKYLPRLSRLQGQLCEKIHELERLQKDHVAELGRLGREHAAELDRARKAGDDLEPHKNQP